MQISENISIRVIWISEKYITLLEFYGYQKIYRYENSSDIKNISKLEFYGYQKKCRYQKQLSY